MRVIDAHTGAEVHEGDVLNSYRVLKIEPGLFSARMLIDSARGRTWVPLQVRWMHPSYFLQHVAFVPS